MQIITIQKPMEEKIQLSTFKILVLEQCMRQYSPYTVLSNIKIQLSTNSVSTTNYYSLGYKTDVCKPNVNISSEFQNWVGIIKCCCVTSWVPVNEIVFNAHLQRKLDWTLDGHHCHRTYNSAMISNCTCRGAHN